MLLLSDLLKKNQRSPEDEAEIEEHAALSVLRRWGEMKEFLPGAVPLVPEHVEIRSLLNQDKPGLPQVTTTQPITTVQTVTTLTYCCWYNCTSTLVCACVFQGYLHMWVDMFPTDTPAPPPVDIKPRLPEQ